MLLYIIYVIIYYIFLYIILYNIVYISCMYQSTWNSRYPYPPLVGALDMPMGSKYPTGTCARKVAGFMLASFGWFWMFLVRVTSNKLLVSINAIHSCYTAIQRLAHEWLNMVSLHLDFHSR